MCLCLVISIFPLGWAEEWLPYFPTPDQVFFTFVENDGASNMTVTILFYDTGYNVSDWGEPQISGNIISVDSMIWEWTGITTPVFIYESFNYTLGDLAPGSYLFNFNVWGYLVKYTTFTVGEPVHLPSIYIRADGSIDPPTAPISTIDNVTYILSGSITTDLSGIMIEKDNVTLDGDGYTLQGSGSGYGINLTGRSYVTIRNMSITAFNYGVYLYSSSSNTVSGNNITANNSYGIWLTYASEYNSLIGNKITNSSCGVRIDDSSYNDITRNSIANNFWGIGGYFASRNCIRGNDISANSGIGITIDQTLYCNITGNNIASNTLHGIWLSSASFNSITGNNIADNGDGVGLYSTSENIFYHNNFIDNEGQVYSYQSANTWDNGYPSGGNYWRDYWKDYDGVDGYRSLGWVGKDGFDDSPYVIDVDNQDNYPFMHPFLKTCPWSSHDIGIKSMTLSQTIVPEYRPLYLWIEVSNYGENTETSNITLRIGETVIADYPVALGSGESNFTQICWNTTAPKGNYTVLTLVTPVENETDITDNAVSSSIILTRAGDVNGDQQVNAKDAIRVGMLFQASDDGDPRYDTNVDIDQDGWIQAKEAVIIGVNFDF